MKMILVAVAAAAAVVVGIVGAALASGTSAAAHQRAPVAYDGADGWHGGRARLPVIYIGESSVFARTPHWSRWSSSSASANGTLWVDTCSPTCAAGHYRTYAATVTFSRPAVHHGVPYFSRMTLRYWHGHQRSYVYTWGVLPGATMPGWNGGPAG